MVVIFQYALAPNEFARERDFLSTEKRTVFQWRARGSRNTKNKIWLK